jgi:hypothetical protein
VTDAAPLRVCWSLQRTIDGGTVKADTGFVPSHFEFEVTTAGVIIVPDTRIRGRWTTLSADSVHAEWGEGQRRVWLFGSVRQDRFTGSGHVFTRVGASVLVTYTGVRVARSGDVLDRPASVSSPGPGHRQDRSSGHSFDFLPSRGPTSF